MYQYSHCVDIHVFSTYRTDAIHYLYNSSAGRSENLTSSGEFSNASTTCSMPIGECLNYGQYAIWQVRLQCVPIDLYHMIKRMVHSNVPGLEWIDGKIPVLESLLLYHPIVVGIIITEIMMTAWQACGFRVTKPWWGESTGRWWIPITKVHSCIFFIFSLISANTHSWITGNAGRYCAHVT